MDGQVETNQDKLCESTPAVSDETPFALSNSAARTEMTPARTERYEISFPLVNRTYAITIALIFSMPLVHLPFLLWQTPHVPSSSWTVVISMAVMMLAGLATIILLAVKKAKMVMSDKGIWFSYHWLALGKRRLRPWDDLHSIQLIYPGISVPEDTPIVWRGEKRSWQSLLLPTRWSYCPWLLLDFSSGGTARIILNKLSRDQAQDLFRALDTWNSPSKFASEVVNLERSLLLGGDDILSFTKLWEDQLNAQYVSTNYVPLPTNHTFQNGAYKVLMELGAGGMSAVYLASDRNGKKVVVKEAVTPPGTDERQIMKSRELFEREATLLMKLDHPQIAKVLDYFVERGRDYLVLEYIKGQTLKQLVKETGKQKEAQVLQWTQQIAEIIRYLHAQNPPILHRDLTPDNLILSDKGRIKLVDFGAASEYVGSATGTFIGKQCYIPPEQLRGKAVPESDHYALGGTMQFLLTGKDPVALCQSHPRELESTTSVKLDELVADLTAMEPTDRPGDAALASRIEALAVGAKKAHAGR